MWRVERDDARRAAEQGIDGVPLLALQPRLAEHTERSRWDSPRNLFGRQREGPWVKQHDGGRADAAACNGDGGGAKGVPNLRTVQRSKVPLEC